MTSRPLVVLPWSKLLYPSFAPTSPSSQAYHQLNKVASQLKAMQADVMLNYRGNERGITRTADLIAETGLPVSAVSVEQGRRIYTRPPSLSVEAFLQGVANKAPQLTAFNEAHFNSRKNLTPDLLTSPKRLSQIDKALNSHRLHYGLVLDAYGRVSSLLVSNRYKASTIRQAIKDFQKDTGEITRIRTTPYPSSPFFPNHRQVTLEGPRINPPLSLLRAITHTHRPSPAFPSSIISVIDPEHWIHLKDFEGVGLNNRQFIKNHRIILYPHLKRVQRLVVDDRNAQWLNSDPSHLPQALSKMADLTSPQGSGR